MEEVKAAECENCIMCVSRAMVFFSQLINVHKVATKENLGLLKAVAPAAPSMASTPNKKASMSQPPWITEKGKAKVVPASQIRSLFLR